MTFQEWVATKQGPRVLTDDDAGAYEGETGYAYEAGFILHRGCLFVVPLPQSEDAHFATLAAAEEFLWTEWCQGEING